MLETLEFINGQLVAVEKVDLSQCDIAETCRHLGIVIPVQSRRKSAQRRGNVEVPYVRTIPLSWVQQAAHLPGKALYVGILLWYLAGVSKSFTVWLTRALMRRFGLPPETGRRGLLVLEHAQLVDVERHGKQNPWVTLLKVPTAVNHEPTIDSTKKDTATDE
jgi:hypothetical protein